MDRLGEAHIAFLRTCDGQPWKKHPTELPPLEMQQMVDEGLLVRYAGVPCQYAITKIGSQVAKSFGATPELIDLAEKFVVSRGYTADAAKQIVAEHGAETILRSKTGEGQREVKVPLNEQGKAEIKFKG